MPSASFSKRNSSSSSIEAGRSSCGAALTASWGEVNRLDAGHPLRNLPLIGRWLELPPVPQPGSMASVRVATPSRGAVFRMVVSPARPEAGILAMAGGQSGHFMSPQFRDQQDAWSSGAPAPFMSLETVDTFSLEPAENH